MKRTSKKLISILLALIFTLSLVPNSFIIPTTAVEADNQMQSESKVFSCATLDDDFADNVIMIVLNKEETFKFRNYTIEDFDDNKIVRVENLTASTGEMIKNRLDNQNTFTNNNPKSESNSNCYANEIIDDNGDFLSCKIVERFRTILYIELSENSKENVLVTIKKLENNDKFLYVGPDYRSSICNTPNDPKYNEQWGLPKIQAPSAWDIQTNVLATIPVGVVDSGIQASHPDLINRIYSSKHRDFSTGVTGGLAVSVSDLTDPHGHGTHVAGIIGAQGNNSTGGTGVCWDIRLISLRACDTNGNTNNSYLVNAIDYAQSQKIKLLNMSLGGPNNDYALETAISNYSGLIVAAAGNNDNNTDTNPFYPASYSNTHDNVISVGATDSNDDRSNWNGFLNLWGLLGSSKSNYGQTTVDVFAPGTDIYSTLNGSSYGKKSGTSMAAPYVTGVAALIMSIRTSLKPSDIKYMINYTSDSKTSLANLCVSGGRLNAKKALEAASNTNIINVSTIERYTERIATISLSVGYRDYIVTFANAGNRVLQTFGGNTTSHNGYLELYDMQGNMLAYDDDSGYERNALINYSFQNG